MPDLNDAFREIVRDVVREELRAAREADTKAAEWLTPALAAEVAHVSARTLRDWIKAGRLEATRVGRLIRIKRADLEKALARGTSKPTTADSLRERARREAARDLGN